MTTTLIIIGIFAGFFFLVVRPLQKKTGNYDVEMRKTESPSTITDPAFMNVPGNLYYDSFKKD